MFGSKKKKLDIEKEKAYSNVELANIAGLLDDQITMAGLEFIDIVPALNLVLELAKCGQASNKNSIDISLGLVLNLNGRTPTIKQKVKPE